MYSSFLSFMDFICNNNLHCIYLSFEDVYVCISYRGFINIVNKLLFLCNFHTPDLSDDHHVVREHPIHTFLQLN